MRLKFIRYIVIFIGCVIILFIITNPSFNQFKSFIGQGRDSKNIYNKKTSNWAIFSTYESSQYEEIEPDEYSNKQKFRVTTTRYFAIFLNFYESGNSTDYKEFYPKSNNSE